MELSDSYETISGGRAPYPRWQSSLFATQSGAHDVAKWLVRAWERPVRHNRAVERAALWELQGLRAQTDAMLYRAERLSEWRPDVGTPLVRYQVEAAIRTIPHLLPYNDDELKILGYGMSDADNRRWKNGPDHPPQAALFRRWHQWLWISREAPNPEAQRLAEACSVLSQAIPQVFEAHYEQHGYPVRPIVIEPPVLLPWHGE